MLYLDINHVIVQLLGQLPCFCDGNLELVQSGAIVRYLARKHDLYGLNASEAALIDMVYDGQEDLRYKFVEKMLYTKANYASYFSTQYLLLVKKQ